MGNKIYRIGDARIFGNGCIIKINALRSRVKSYVFNQGTGFNSLVDLGLFFFRKMRKIDDF